MTELASVRNKSVRWYMGHVAGRYCPCEWPVKIRFMIRLCGRIDDANEKITFADFARFHLCERRNRTSSTAQSLHLEHE